MGQEGEGVVQERSLTGLEIGNFTLGPVYLDPILSTEESS